METAGNDDIHAVPNLTLAHEHLAVGQVHLRQGPSLSQFPYDVAELPSGHQDLLREDEHVEDRRGVCGATAG